MEESKNAQTMTIEQSLNRAEERVAAMMRVGRSLTAVHDLDELLGLVVDQVTIAMDSDRTTIFLVDEETNEIWSKVAQGDDVKQIRMKIGTGLAGWVAKTGKSVNLKNAYRDDRFNPQVDKLTGYKTDSMLVVALRGKQGEILGVIQTLNKRGGHFITEDEQLLEALCSPIAIAIENARLVLSVLDKNIKLMEAQHALAQKVGELDVLFRLEREISCAIRTDDILTRLLHQSVDMLGCEAGSFLLVSDDTGELIFSNAVGDRQDEVKRLRIPRGAGVAGWVAENGQPALVSDPAADSRHLKHIEQRLDFPVRSILAVPLAIGDLRIGAMELLNKRDGQFSQEDLKLATLIAGRAASAVQVGRQREQREKAERLASIGQALSSVIHDFKTPMTIISGYVQLMAMEEDAEDRKQHAEVVLRQFDFINDMTKELLAFARGESELLLHKVYVDRLLDDLRELLTKELAQNNVELRLEDSYGGPIRMDEVKFRRLVFNLARNARQAMAEGGVFSIRVSRQDDGVVFEFCDTGPGIPQEIRHRLFESFVTSGKPDGTGLGLAVVKKIVDEHGGRIELKSEPGKGACFSVWLPRRTEG